MPPVPDSLTSARLAVGDHLDALPAESVLWSPSPEAWSSAGVLEHLIRTERGLLRGIGHAVAQGDAREDIGLRSPEALAQVTAFLGSGRRTRVPTAAARFVAPRGDVDYADLRAEWDALDGLWREALSTIPDDLAEVGIVLHPMAGPISGDDAAMFVSNHARHHLQQLERLREAWWAEEGASGTTPS